MYRYYEKEGLAPADLKGSFSLEMFPDIRIDGKQVACNRTSNFITLVAFLYDEVTAVAADHLSIAPHAATTHQVSLTAVTSNASYHRCNRTLLLETQP